MRGVGRLLLVAVLMVLAVSAEEMWERWADRALDTCTKLILNRKGRARLELICDNFQEVAEEELRMLAINVRSSCESLQKKKRTAMQNK